MVELKSAARRLALACAACLALGAAPQPERVPTLTQPVNDFAGVVDTASAARIDGTIRALQQATGDVVVVATIETFAPFAAVQEYAVRQFENNGQGIGEKGKHNGLLVLLAVKDRKVWIEVGYGLEEFITDGFAGETSREVMAPAFRRGDYGGGLEAGVTRIVGRIAQGRGVTLQNVPAPAPRRRSSGFPGWAVILVIILILMASSGFGGPTRRRRGFFGGWGGGGWSGWTSGVGSFGGGGGGGFGGGFGGFSGGGSGGGGGGASW